MSIRDERAAVIRRHYRDLTDDLGRALPRVLDELENIDERQQPEPFLTMGGRKVELTPEQEAQIRADFAQAAKGPVTVMTEPRPPTDAEITAWIEAHPREFEAWVRKQNRINGTAPTEQAARAPRRRAAPK